MNPIILVLLSLTAISAIQGDTIKCYVGVATAHGDNKVDHLIPTTCPEDVTKCMKTSAGFGQTSSSTYACGQKTEGSISDSLGSLGSIFEDGCKKHENKGANELLAGLTGQEASSEICVCTGNLCNSAGSNQFNLILAFLCTFLALFRLAY